MLIDSACITDGDNSKSYQSESEKTPKKYSLPIESRKLDDEEKQRLNKKFPQEKRLT